MQHKTLDEVGQIAKISPEMPRPMSRRERLERWATVLERLDRKPLKSLMRVEFLTEDERSLLRDDNTPLSIAYGDPVLREDGLASDRYGDNLAFFELTRDEAHYLVCDCHYHGSMTASEVAGRVRSVARRFSVREFWSRAFSAG
jgi:hypothetical protein